MHHRTVSIPLNEWGALEFDEILGAEIVAVKTFSRVEQIGALVVKPILGVRRGLRGDRVEDLIRRLLDVVEAFRKQS